MSTEDSTAKETCCDRCGKPVGSIWFVTPEYEVLCLKCYKETHKVAY